MSKMAGKYDSSKRGPLALEELQAVFQYRGLILQLIRRDLISRYKRSFFGVAWTMLNPLGTMLILTLVFSALFKAVNSYPVYLLSGLITWNFFAQTTSATLTQNIWGSSLLHRIYLPRTAFSLAAVGTGLVNFFLSTILLIIIIILVGFKLQITILFLPISMILLAGFSLGLGLMFSTLAIYFPDIVDMFQVSLTAWMYITPIFYPAEILPDSIRDWLLGLNPMYYFIQLVRLPAYDGLIPPLNTFLICVGISLFTLVTGWFIFSWRANELTYRT